MGTSGRVFNEASERAGVRVLCTRLFLKLAYMLSQRCHYQTLPKVSSHLAFSEEYPMIFDYVLNDQFVEIKNQSSFHLLL